MAEGELIKARLSWDRSPEVTILYIFIFVYFHGDGKRAKEFMEIYNVFYGLRVSVL